MKKSCRLVFLLLICFSPELLSGQETFLPRSSINPAFAPFEYRYIEIYNEKAVEALNNGDLIGLNSTIEILNNLNISKDPVVCGSIENQRGILEYYRGNSTGALQNYMKALDYFNQSGSKDGISLIMNNIALIFAHIEDLESTQKYLRKALDFTPVGDISSQTLYMLNLAEVELKMGNYETGLSIANELLDLYLPGSVNFSKIAIYGLFVACYQKLGNNEEAIKWIEKGLDSISENDSYLDLLAFYIMITEYYFLEKDYEKVLDCGSKIYPPPDPTFLRDLYPTIDMMAKSARFTGAFHRAIELDRVANNLEYSRADLRREELISLLMVEYSSNRDLSDHNLATREFRENNLKEEIQRRFIVHLALITVVMIVSNVFLSRTRKIRNRYKESLSEKNLKLESINLQLGKNNKELEKENQLLDTLISVFAHDLINPFQAILGFSQLMITDHEELNRDEFIEYTELLSDTSFQLSQLLINLKSLAIVQDESRKLNPVRFSIRPAVNNILKLFEPAARKKSITFLNENCDPAYAFINKDIFESAFRNILSNAVKFSTENSPIRISFSRDSSTVEITVEDYGIGMPDEIRRKLLNRNYLESRPGTSNEKGSGIGLAISIELLELFNSSLDITSTVGEGTRIILKMPASDE